MTSLPPSLPPPPSLEEDVLPFIVRQQFKGPDAFGTAVSVPMGNTEVEVRGREDRRERGREGGREGRDVCTHSPNNSVSLRPSLPLSLPPSLPQATIAALSAGSAYARPDDGPRCFAYTLDPSKGGGREGGREGGGMYCSKLTSTPAYMLMNREVREGGREGGREGEVSMETKISNVAVQFISLRSTYAHPSLPLSLPHSFPPFL